MDRSSGKLRLYTPPAVGAFYLFTGGEESALKISSEFDGENFLSLPGLANFRSDVAELKFVTFLSLMLPPEANL